MAGQGTLIYAGPIGFGSGSKSLRGRATAIDPLQLYTLSPGATIASGVLTWGALRGYQAAWGNGATLRYTGVQPGYSYVWDIDKKTFIVTADTGQVTAYNNMRALTDLGIAWEVLRSDQFTVLFPSCTNSNIFLIASRLVVIRDSAVAEKELLEYNDYLAENSQHIAFNRLSYRGLDFSSVNNPGGGTYDPEVYTIFYGDEAARTILLSKAEKLQITNLYPLDMLGAPEELQADRTEIIHGGHYYDRLSYLMIALFAQNMLSGKAEILYEPWMLYAVFQWYFNTVHNMANNRKIFDLSPRWG